MWQDDFNRGLKQLDQGQLAEAEASFSAALNYARQKFKHTDTRIPDSFAFLGRTLLLQKKTQEAAPALRQAVNIAKHMQHKNKDIAITRYLWAYIDTAEDASERRQQALDELNEYLKANEIQNIQNKLKQLFTVRNKPGTEPKPKPAPEQPVTKTELPLPEPMAEPEPQPPIKPEPKLEPKKEPAPGTEPKLDQAEPICESGFFRSHLWDRNQADVESSQEAEAKTVEPQHYADWSARLNAAMERAAKPELSEILCAYVDMHDLMTETVRLYKPPHTAVGDHLLALADIANTVGMVETAGELTWLALRNFQLTLGPRHGKTGYAHLALAQAFREQENYVQCSYHFNAACNILQSLPDLDREWFQKVVSQYQLLQHRERLQAQLDRNLDEMTRLCQDGKAVEADKLGCETYKLLMQFFPPDHYAFVSLFHRHATALYSKQDYVASQALERIAKYLDAKLQDKYTHNNEMAQLFPSFSLKVVQALYNDKIIGELKQR